LPTTPKQNLAKWESELRTLKARVEEINRRLDTPVEVWSNPFGEPQDHAEPQEERVPPKTRLRFSLPKGHRMKLSGTPGPTQAVIKQRNDFLERIATIERLIQTEKAAVAAPLRASSTRTDLNYPRSALKRMISLQFARNPKATDSDICRALDSDGGIDLPRNWKNSREDRSFFGAYSNPRTRHTVEVAISRVRNDHRRAGILT
jgi:hypothetical protein